MRRNFELTFPTDRGDFKLSVAIQKSFGDRISFKTGYNGQPVKYIKVTAIDSDLAKITDKDQIGRVVQHHELESLHPTEDNEYIVIDKAGLKTLYPSTPEMAVLKTLPRSKIPFHRIDKFHYFLNVKRTKKGKKRVTNPDDMEMYNVVYNGLKEKDQILLVRYTAMNTQKCAIIYAVKDGLRMSNLIASNYQKERDDEQETNDESKSKVFERLTRKSRRKRLKSKDTVDDYGEKLEELVAATITGTTLRTKKPIKRSYSRLASLECDTDDDSDEDSGEE